MSTPDCTVCQSHKIKKVSIIWCQECDKGLCTECEQHHKVSKETRHHAIVPIEDYKRLLSIISQIKNTCERHKEKYELFCKIHDSPCCKKCITENHEGCNGIAVLGDVIKKVKSSTSFKDLENQLKDIQTNIEEIRKNRKENAALLVEHGEFIKNEVSIIRKKINDRLDKLQENILSELADMEINEERKGEELLISLKKKEEETKAFEINMEIFKKYGSEMQTYMGMKHIEGVTMTCEYYIHKLIENLEQVSLSFKVNDETMTVFESWHSFGTVTIERKPIEMTLETTKHKQAQMMVAVAPLMSIDKVNLKLERKITTDIKKCLGCCLLPDGRIILTSFYKPYHLYVFRKEGVKDFSVHLMSSHPKGVTSISNSEVAVATNGGIKIVDIDNRSIARTINIKELIWGIEYCDGTLIYCTKDGIMKINLTNESVTSLLKYPLSTISFVTTNNNNIYFIDRDTNKVICSDMSGRIHWEFQDESVLKGPCDITSDLNGNMYVAGRFSCNVVILSIDGQNYTEILYDKDDIFYPTVLHCDRTNNKLLLVNINSKAILYNIESL